MPHSRVPICSSSREKSATIFQVCLRLALLYNTPSEMLEQRKTFLPPHTAEINEVGSPCLLFVSLEYDPKKQQAFWSISA